MWCWIHSIAYHPFSFADYHGSPSVAFEPAIAEAEAPTSQTQSSLSQNLVQDSYSYPLHSTFEQFVALRILSEDCVAPKTGFPTHKPASPKRPTTLTITRSTGLSSTSSAPETIHDSSAVLRLQEGRPTASKVRRVVIHVDGERTLKR